MKENVNEEGECGVSIDSTWQKRSHASPNGVVSVISLDSKKYQQCQKWQAKTNDSKYHEWKAYHNCKVNHTGSANSMEAVSALRIFERSLATKGLKHKDMVGESDSATCNTVVENEPYGENCIPNKLECIAHVQEKVGSRLRNLKSANKELKLDDGKIWLEKVN